MARERGRSMIEPALEIFISLITACVASNGFWIFWQSRQRKKSAETTLLKSIAYGLIRDRCERYIEQGYISSQDYKDLADYLYPAYKSMGGDGMAERLMKEIEKLEIKSEHHD